MKAISRRTRAGFTLIEVMLSMTLLLFVLGVATNTFRRSSSQLAAQSGRLEAQQTALFTLGELDRELRIAGTGVADMQPVLVQADSMSVTFNADQIGFVLDDPSPVYIDTAADPLMVTAFRSTNKKLVPMSTTFFYPDSTHMRSAGVPSGAETISFWLSKDSTSSATNEYILWRRVNHGPHRVVAKGIVRNPGDTTFQYFKHDSVGNLTPIPKTQLPLYHNASTHGIKADSGTFALVDSIKTIRVRMVVAYKDRTGPVLRRLDHTIRVMNAGLVRRATCGEIPQGVTPIVVASLDTSGVPLVTITFDKSADETLGEKDAERYALFKRLASESSIMNEPFASIPAGSETGTYTFVDQDVVPGAEMVYGVSVQDCTPASSSVSIAAAVTIPTPP